MFKFMRKARHFLVLEGYDPRIHAVFFCPLPYKYDFEKKLVPLQGDEIGRLIAHAVEGGITEGRPWYDPSEKLPDRPIIDAQMNMEFDTVVVPSWPLDFSGWSRRTRSVRLPQHRRLAQAGRKKRNNGPPPQPRLPATRHAIVDLTLRPPTQRCPYCKRRIREKQRRK